MTLPPINLVLGGAPPINLILGGVLLIVAGVLACILIYRDRLLRMSREPINRAAGWMIGHGCNW